MLTTMGRWMLAAAVAVAVGMAGVAPAQMAATPTVAPAAVPGGALVFEATHLDMGRVPEGQVVDIAFKVRNPTASPVAIRAIRPSCGCTTAGGNPSEIKAGEETTIKVALNTQGRPGRNHKSVLIETDEPGGGRYNLSFSVDVTQEVYLEASMIDLGTLAPGQGVTRTFSAFSTLPTPLEIQKVTTTMSAVTARLVESVPFERDGQKGTEYRFEVVVPPTMPQGDFYFNVTIENNGPHTLRQNFRGQVAGNLDFSPKQFMVVATAGGSHESAVQLRSRIPAGFTIVEVKHDTNLAIDFEVVTELPRRQTVKARIVAPQEPGNVLGKVTVVARFEGETETTTLDIPLRVVVRPVAPAPVAARPAQ
jgi:hypothetical protein